MELKKVIIKSHDGQNQQMLAAIKWDTFQTVWSKNESYQLSFTAYDDVSLSFNLLSVENSVIYDGQEYVIKQIVDDYNGGEHSVQVTATHIMYNLNSVFQYSLKAGDVSLTLSEALSFLFKNVKNYSYKVHGTFNSSKKMTDFGNTSITEGLSSLKETFKIYAIIPDGHVIHLYSEKEYVIKTNKVFRYRHDTTEVQLQYDSVSMVNQVQAVSTAEKPLFSPFLVSNDDSIKQWGVRQGARVESDTISDANQMKTLASQSFVLQPTISLALTSAENQSVKMGEIWAVQILETGLLTKVEVVSITRTPFSDVTPIQIELNNSRANYLDAQKAQNKIIKNIKASSGGDSSINMWVVGNVEE